MRQTSTLAPKRFEGAGDRFSTGRVQEKQISRRTAETADLFRRVVVTSSANYEIRVRFGRDDKGEWRLFE
jgi:hypothetical protein